jgi:hypothetical protein
MMTRTNFHPLQEDMETTSIPGPLTVLFMAAIQMAV